MVKDLTARAGLLVSALMALGGTAAMAQSDVTPEEVAENIRRFPYFQSNGQFFGMWPPRLPRC